MSTASLAIKRSVCMGAQTLYRNLRTRVFSSRFLNHRPQKKEEGLVDNREGRLFGLFSSFSLRSQALSTSLILPL